MRLGTTTVVASLSLAVVAAATGCSLAPLATAVARRPADPELRPDGPRDGTERPLPRTIPMELVFVRSAVGDSQLERDLWEMADEQTLDAAVRRRLTANGLRVGTIHADLPATLAARFRPQSVGADELPATPEERPAVVRKILRLLPGRPSEVVTATGIDQLVLLEHDGHEVHGTTFRDAGAHFALRAWPAADGRVRIELTPTIRHGPIERSWVGEDGVFRLENGQREHVFERLRFTAMLPPGTMLLIGHAGEESANAGDALLRDRDRAHPTMRLLALRPLARANDPLFTAPAGVTAAPHDVDPPAATVPRTPGAGPEDPAVR